MEFHEIFAEKFDTHSVEKRCNILLVGDSGTQKTRFHNSYVEEEQFCRNDEPSGKIVKLGSVSSNFPPGTSTVAHFYEVSDPDTETFEKWVKKAQWILIFFNFEDRQSFKNLPCWFNRIRKLRPTFTQISFVGMNSDSTSEDKVSEEEMKKLDFCLNPNFGIFKVEGNNMWAGSDKVYNFVLDHAYLTDVDPSDD
nr:Rab-like GTPase [Pithovirus mammoth]